MGLFDFLKSKAQTGSDNENYTNGGNTTVIPENIFLERNQPTDHAATNENTEETLIITNNLDQLYRFLDRNLESKGYDDALINPDSYHLQQNIDALSKELMRTIQRVKVFYEDFIREINFHIESRSRSGMVDTVEELKMKKETAESHIDKVHLLEAAALNNEGDSQGIIISYTRGFRNGLAAISHHAIISKKF